MPDGKLQFNRGNEADKPVLNDGEPYFSEDTNKLNVGNDGTDAEFNALSDAEKSALNNGGLTFLQKISALNQWLAFNGFGDKDALVIPHNSLPNNYAIIDANGIAHWMVEVPRKNWNPTNLFASSTIHPAFTINGLQKRIFIGKYQASLPGTNYVTWANQIPKHSLTFDEADAVANALNDGDNITGFHLMTNAEWALVALVSKALGVTVYGNNNYGRDVENKLITGILESGYEANFGSTSPARWLTGSGGIKTSHDNTEAGIFDLNGNVHEWVRGLRLNEGEIQILVNNNAADYTKDVSASSAEWKAILADGSIVDPGTANTLKLDASNPGAIVETIINQDVDPDSQSNTFETQTTALSGAGIDLLKKLAIHPYTTSLNSDGIYFGNYNERLPIRGGNWNSSTHAGLWFLYLSYPRSVVSSSIGFRFAFAL